MVLENSTLTELLAGLENLLPVLTLPNLIDFIVYASALRDDILLTQPANHDPDIPPDYLSDGHCKFLSQVLSTDEATVCLCWESLRDVIWEGSMSERLIRSPLQGFKDHGRPYGLSKSRIRYYIASR